MGKMAFAILLIVLLVCPFSPTGEQAEEPLKVVVKISATILAQS